MREEPFEEIPQPQSSSYVSSFTSLLSSYRLNKWQIALLIGTPIVFGTGIYWYYYRDANQKNKKDTKKIVNDNSNRNTVESSDAVSNDPFTKAMALKNKGNKYFKARKYEDAIQCYSDAITLCPKDKTEDISTFYQNRAASFESLKDYKSVIDDCSRAIQLNKKYIKALLRRAKAFEETGQLQDALNDITAVCIIEQFQNGSSLLMTDRLLKQSSKLKAKALMKIRDPRMPSNTFIKHYFASFSNDPLIKDKETPINIENIRINLENKRKEMGDIISPELMLYDGTVSILKGQIEAAEKELENLIKLPECPNDIKVNALVKLGTIKIQEINASGDSLNDCLKYFDDAILNDPNNPDIYLHRAQIYLLSERVDDARKDLEKCCELNDLFEAANAQKLYVQFRCAVQSDNKTALRNAIKGFEEAIEKFNNSSEVYSLYAQALMEQQEFSKADEYFAKALEIDPNDGNLYVHRGILHLQWNNDIEKALKYLEDAKRVDPTCQFAWEMIGSIEVQRGNLQNGLESFDNALDLAQTELDCSHLYQLRDAAEAQLKAIKSLGIELPS